VAARYLLILLAAASGLAVFADSVSSYIRRDADWFRSDEGRGITRNVQAWQTSAGAWPKNVDTSKPPSAKTEKGTFDNGATVDELRFLARAFNATQDGEAKESFIKGLDLILRAQYATGGWPQSHPPGDGYHRHITFNDQTMVRLMRFTREVATDANFQFVDEERRNASRAAFQRGITCIVRSQVSVEGALTAWCAQHDEQTLEPRPARSFELVSLSGAESAGILDLLMSVEEPSAEVVAAIESGVAWFENVKIRGFRQERIDRDKRMVADPKAPALWARFYEIGTNRPIFAGRNGIKRYSIEEIEAERRNGYAWYGNWGRELPKKHEQWKKRVSRGPFKRGG
jgi:pectate lyase